MTPHSSVSLMTSLSSVSSILLLHCILSLRFTDALSFFTRTLIHSEKLSPYCRLHKAQSSVTSLHQQEAYSLQVLINHGFRRMSYCLSLRYLLHPSIHPSDRSLAHSLARKLAHAPGHLLAHSLRIRSELTESSPQSGHRSTAFENVAPCDSHGWLNSNSSKREDFPVTEAGTADVDRRRPARIRSRVQPLPK